nr:hypothetical protein [Microvirga sp. KLBC 81]
MEVSLHSRLPPVEHVLRATHHHLAIARKALAGESGCGEAALPTPELALAGDQTISEHGGDVPPQEIVLDEIAVLFHEDGLDQLRGVDQEGRPCPQLEGNDITVLA